jgi:hypothetical protein
MTGWRFKTIIRELRQLARNVCLFNQAALFWLLRPVA